MGKELLRKMRWVQMGKEFAQESHLVLFRSFRLGISFSIIVTGSADKVISRLTTRNYLHIHLLLDQFSLVSRVVFFTLLCWLGSDFLKKICKFLGDSEIDCFSKMCKSSFAV